MTKHELEKAIKNGESVWWITDEYVLDTSAKVVELFYEYKPYIKDHKVKLFMKSGWWREFNISSLYKTKAEAEHYLHHANITRTETLPFLTWEEFNEKGGFDFIGKNLNRYEIIINTYNNKISIYENDEIIKNYDLTEANFYKAYDECVRLFKGEE